MGRVWYNALAVTCGYVQALSGLPWLLRQLFATSFDKEQTITYKGNSCSPQDLVCRLLLWPQAVIPTCS